MPLNPNSAPGEYNRRAQILIVDDAAVVRQYYRHLLECQGYDVDEAINGIEGLEKAFHTRFDLCVVDVNMPLMDGHAFLQALRTEQMTLALPVLITSSEAGPRDRKAAMDAGANAYLVKPVAQDVFAANVAALLTPALR